MGSKPTTADRPGAFSRGKIQTKRKRIPFLSRCVRDKGLLLILLLLSLDMIIYKVAQDRDRRGRRRGASESVGARPDPAAFRRWNIEVSCDTDAFWNFLEHG